MDRTIEQGFKSLAGKSIASVEVRGDDSVELHVPESEGWRLVISATMDMHAKPALLAHWEPGLRRPHCPAALRRIVAFPPRRAARRHAQQLEL